MIRVTTLIAVATALVLAASGCGGSKKSSAGASSGSTSTVTSGGSSSSGSSSSGSSSSGSSSSSSGSGTSTSGSSGSGTSSGISKSCLDFASSASKLGQALSSGGSTQSAENLKTYFNELAAKAPSDIKASFQTLAEAITKYADAIKKLDLKPGKTPSATDLQKMQSAISSISTAKVRAASDKIQAWVQAGCHS